MPYDYCLNPDCRRPLTDPASRARGFGPDCWKKRRPRRLGEVLRGLPIAKPAAELIPGQQELDLDGDDE